MTTTLPLVAGFLLLLGLGFFFGLAFEEFHAQGGPARRRAQLSAAGAGRSAALPARHRAPTAAERRVVCAGPLAHLLLLAPCRGNRSGRPAECRADGSDLQCARVSAWPDRPCRATLDGDRRHGRR